jgi:hypothetical protein
MNIKPSIFAILGVGLLVVAVCAIRAHFSDEAAKLNAKQAEFFEKMEKINRELTSKKVVESIERKLPRLERVLQKRADNFFQQDPDFLKATPAPTPEGQKQ